MVRDFGMSARFITLNNVRSCCLSNGLPPGYDHRAETHKIGSFDNRSAAPSSLPPTQWPHQSSELLFGDILKPFSTASTQKSPEPDRRACGRLIGIPHSPPSSRLLYLEDCTGMVLAGAHTTTRFYHSFRGYGGRLAACFRAQQPDRVYRIAAMIIPIALRVGFMSFPALEKRGYASDASPQFR